MKTVPSRMFLWLAVTASVMTAGQSVQSSTQAPRGEQEGVDDRRNAQGRSHDGGAVVAQLVQQLSAMKDRIHSLETGQLTANIEFQATKTELQATKTELQVTKTELQATKTELQATKTELQATKTELQATKTELHATKTELQATKTELQAIKTRQEATERRLQSTKTELNAGSSFVRWGRKSCPNKTSLVYVGVAGGKHWNQKGSGTNSLCLTRTPRFDNTAIPRYYGYLYGAEYEWISGHHDHDVPCSVCLAPQSATIMVPGTLTCPPGWTPQYTGHLASNYREHYATEYVCLDGSPENDSSGVRSDDGLAFFYVVTVCGSLPCPPYVNTKVVTCVVCSK